MNVALKPELQQFIDEKVKAGAYASAEELVEAALARLMLDPDPEPDEQTWDVIEAGDAQIERGEVIDWRKFAAEMRRKYCGS